MKSLLEKYLRYNKSKLEFAITTIVAEVSR